MKEVNASCLKAFKLFEDLRPSFCCGSLLNAMNTYKQTDKMGMGIWEFLGLKI